MTDKQDEVTKLDNRFVSGARADGLTEEDRSKDAFFVRVAEVAEAMIARHGRDFAMGTLILSARFIAEGKPLIKRSGVDAKLS